MKYLFAGILFFSVGLVYPLQAQVDEGPMYVKVELNSGEEIFGWLTERDNSGITVEMETGEVRILPNHLVKKIEFIDPPKRGPAIDQRDYLVQNTRHLITGNAIGLKRGEGYYRNAWILFNEASYGITDRLSISAGLIPTFLFGANQVPYWLSPKVNFPIKKDLLYVSGGVLVASISGELPGLVGLGFGTVTFGKPTLNISLTGGFAFSSGQVAYAPVFNLSGMAKITPKFYLVTENFIVSPDEFYGGGLFSLAGRSIWPGISLDYGLFFISESVGAALPWLGIMVPFK